MWRERWPYALHILKAWVSRISWSLAIVTQVGYTKINILHIVYSRVDDTTNGRKDLNLLKECSCKHSLHISITIYFNAKYSQPCSVLWRLGQLAQRNFSFQQLEIQFIAPGLAICSFHSVYHFHNVFAVLTLRL